VDELIASNPAARFGKLFDLRQDKRKDVAVLEPTQIARVLQAAAKWYPDHELAVTTLFYTGVREGELLGLQWDDFDFQRGTVELRRTVSLGRGERRLIVNTPKSGKIRTVDLPSPCLLVSRTSNQSVKLRPLSRVGHCQRGSSLLRRSQRSR
jgi:integrase